MGYASNKKSDYVFIGKEVNLGISDKYHVKEQTVTSCLNSIIDFIENSTDPIELEFYSDGILIKRINYQAELDPEDMLLLLKSWIAKEETELNDLSKILEQEK